VTDIAATFTRLDLDLLGVLRRETATPNLTFEGPTTRLTGGYWADLVAFRLHGAPPGWQGDLVARVMPDAGIAAKETILQGEAAAQGFATPAVHLAGGADDGLGRPFMVMDRVHGRPLLADLNGAGAIAALPKLARRLPDVLAGALAELHRLDPAPVRERLSAGSSAGFGVAELLSSLRSAAEICRRADLVAAADWLTEHPAGPAPEVVCHGDLHPFNVLVDGHGAVTVLDWSAGRLAPGLHDVAFTGLVLSEPPLVAPRALRPVIRAAGRFLARRFRRSYAGQTGATLNPASLRWHEGVICLRALVEVAGWAAGGRLDDYTGHPWMISGSAFAARLTRLTGIAVTPR
jgi:aminoglycoside phosphotransferase (APT) family kinase protein